MTLMPRKIYELDPDLLRRIEDYRFDNRIKSEVEAVRQLLEFALEAKARERGDGKR